MGKSEKSMRASILCGLAGVSTGLMLVSANPDVALAQEDNNQNLSGTIGFDLSHAYFFRGIKQEREGAVFQPYGDFGAVLYRNDSNPIHSADFHLGVWNSLHSGPSGSGSGGSATHVRSWYEADFFTGVSMGFDNWEAGITYTAYMSPNASFGSVTEIAFNLGMDDSALFGSFSMYPHLVMAVELDGQADGGTSEGVYLEIGVEPGMDIFDGSASVSFPVTFAFSMSNYYENKNDGFDSTFGFFDIGGNISWPMAFMPEGYGDWELSAGLHLMSLGEFLEFVNDGDSTQAIGSFGVSLGF